MKIMAVSKHYGKGMGGVMSLENKYNNLYKGKRVDKLDSIQ